MSYNSWWNWIMYGDERKPTLDHTVIVNEGDTVLEPDDSYVVNTAKGELPKPIPTDSKAVPVSGFKATDGSFHETREGAYIRSEQHREQQEIKRKEAILYDIEVELHQAFMAEWLAMRQMNTYGSANQQIAQLTDMRSDTNSFHEYQRNARKVANWIAHHPDQVVKILKPVLKT